MVVQMLGDPEEVARGEDCLGSPWYLKRTKQEGNPLSDQDGLSCLGKGDREFSKLFYIRIVRFNPPPNQNKQNQNAPLNLNVR